MAVTSFLNGCVWKPTAGGTGTWTVSAAVPPYFTPAQCTNPSVINSGTYNYFAVNSTEYEIGQGVYTVAGTTLTRATIKSSSNGGAAVNFTSAPTVYMGGPLANDMFATVELGDPADTTLTRVSAGVVAVEGINLLKTNRSETLTAGFVTTSFSLGTITGAGQSITPDAANGQHQHCTLNGSSLTGTLTINPPASSTQVVLEVTNGGSGDVAATLSVPATKVDGTWAATNASKFLFILTKTQTYSHCQIVPLQ